MKKHVKVPEVIFQFQYPNNSALRLRIVQMPPHVDAPNDDPRFVLELAEEDNALGEPRWRRPHDTEAKTNVGRLTDLLALAALRERERSR